MDQYSLLHFATGIIAYFIGINFWTWFAIHLFFEIVENTETGIDFINNNLKFWPGGKPWPDAVINSVGDQIFAVLGWYIAYQLDTIGNKYGWYNKHINNAL